MNKIIALDTGYVPPGPNQECIDLLKQMLERAEKGEINGVAIVTISARDAGAYDYIGSAWKGSAHMRF